MRLLPVFIRTRLEGRKELHEVINNTGWMMGDQIIRQGVGLIIGIWLARYLGPQLYGEFSFAFAVVTICSPLATLALSVVALRRMVKEPTQKDEIIGSAFLLMIIGGAFAFIVAMTSVFIARPNDQLAHWLVGILSAGYIFQTFSVIEIWFSSQVQWKYVVFGKTSAFLIISLIKAYLIYLGAPLIAFAWVGLAEIVCDAIGLTVVYRLKVGSMLKWTFNWCTARIFLRDCWPILSVTILNMVHLRIDQVMLGNMVGSGELGKYSVAVRITESWFFIPLIICSSSLPSFLKSEKNYPIVFNAHMQRLYNIMVFVAYSFALPIAFFSKEIIHLLFSDSYLGAGPLLAVLIWTGVFGSLAAARNTLIFSKNWNKINLLSMSMGCLLNVILNILLITKYGAMGAVISTLISYWFTVHVTCFIFKPLRETGWMITKAMLLPKVW